jgi:cytochrome c biogenesis protein CcmG, thiol:disulfide interchange protein DsbE
MVAIGASAPTEHRTRGRLPLPYLVVAAVLPLALLAVYAVMFGLRQAPAGPVVGTPAPDFSLADLDGRPLRLADLQGRPVIVNFWASWCGPCVEEFPLLKRAAAEHADEGLAVIGIVYQDNSESARAFMQRMDAAWPAAMDPGGKVAAAYGLFGAPQTYFIGRDGTLVGQSVGQFSAVQLDQQIAAIIGKEQP